MGKSSGLPTHSHLAGRRGEFIGKDHDTKYQHPQESRHLTTALDEEKMNTKCRHN